MMFMLACAKRLRPTDQRTREGDFLKARQELGRVELLEKKVLIIGLGGSERLWHGGARDSIWKCWPVIRISISKPYGMPV